MLWWYSYIFVDLLTLVLTCSQFTTRRKKYSTKLRTTKLLQIQFLELKKYLNQVLIQERENIVTLSESWNAHVDDFEFTVAPPKPVEPVFSESMGVRRRIKKIQQYMKSFQYNHIGSEFTHVKYSTHFLRLITLSFVNLMLWYSAKESQSAACWMSAEWLIDSLLSSILSFKCFFVLSRSCTNHGQ